MSGAWRRIDGRPLFALKTSAAAQNAKAYACICAPKGCSRTGLFSLRAVSGFTSSASCHMKFHGGTAASLHTFFRTAQVWMPEVSEEGDQVLKAKVFLCSYCASRNGGNGMRPVPIYQAFFAVGPAILRSRSSGFACIVSLYLLPLLLQHGPDKARIAGRTRQSIYQQTGDNGQQDASMHACIVYHIFIC